MGRDAGRCDQHVWGPGSHARPGSGSPSRVLDDAPRQEVQGPGPPATDQETAGLHRDIDRPRPPIASACTPSATPNCLGRPGYGTLCPPRKDSRGQQRPRPHGAPGRGGVPCEHPVPMCLPARSMARDVGSDGAGFLAAVCPLPGWPREERSAAPASAQGKDERMSNGVRCGGLRTERGAPVWEWADPRSSQIRGTSAPFVVTT